MGCEGLFVDWLEDGDGAVVVLDDVGATGAFRGQAGGDLLTEALHDLADAALDLDIVSLHAFADGDLALGSLWNVSCGAGLRAHFDPVIESF